jgi:hypothetical protein
MTAEGKYKVFTFKMPKKDATDMQVQTFSTAINERINEEVESGYAIRTSHQTKNFLTIILTK